MTVVDGFATAATATSAPPRMSKSTSYRARKRAEAETGNGETINHCGESDVLFGRGTSILQRPGNVKFRRYVENLRQKYAEAKREDKSSIARKVVNMVRGNGGRFLRFKGDGSQEVFVEVAVARAVEKCCQALREDGGKGRSKKKKASEPTKLAETNLSAHSRQKNPDSAFTTAVKTTMVKAAVKSGFVSSVQEVSIATKSVGVETSAQRKSASKSTVKSNVKMVTKASRVYHKPPAPTPPIARKRRSTLCQQNGRRRPAIEDEKSEDNTDNDSRQSADADLPGMEKSTESESETLTDSEHDSDGNECVEDVVLRTVRPGEKSPPTDNAALVKNAVIAEKTASVEQSIYASRCTLPRMHQASPSATKPPMTVKPHCRLSSQIKSIIWEKPPPLDTRPLRHNDTSRWKPRHQLSSQTKSNMLERSPLIDTYPTVDVERFHRQFSSRVGSGVLEKVPPLAILSPVYYPPNAEKPRHRLVSREKSVTLERAHPSENVLHHRMHTHQKSNQVHQPSYGLSFDTIPPSFQGPRVPTHRLMISHPSPINNQNEGAPSGWFCDFVNGGTSDPTTSTFHSRWEELFVSLVHFKEVHGHCAVPPAAGSPALVSSAEEKDHARLADWASAQRQVFRDIQSGRRTATDEEMSRFRRLQALGFVWNYDDWHWNRRYEELVKFQSGKGIGVLTGLALWVKEQKNLYLQGRQGTIQSMRDDRLKKLADANFVWAKAASESSRRCADIETSLGNVVTSKTELVNVQKRVPARSVASQIVPRNSLSPELSVVSTAELVVVVSNGVSIDITKSATAKSIVTADGSCISQAIMVPSKASETNAPLSAVTKCSPASPIENSQVQTGDVIGSTSSQAFWK